MGISVIILAAGQGSRMNLGYNKMFYHVDTQSVIEKSVQAFVKSGEVSEIIVVVNEGELSKMKTLLQDYSIVFVTGGQERYHSVYQGLKLVTNKYVLIHDGARCFITSELITKISAATIKYKAACLGVVAKDTIHLVHDDYIQQTPPRQDTYLAQTPQGFETAIIIEAYQKMFEHPKANVTDDVMVLTNYSQYQVRMVTSDYSNIKITTKEDV